MNVARNIPSAAEAAARWQTGFGGAGQRWADGINAVQVAPGQLAAAAKARYMSGVQQNADKWAARVSAVSAAQWKQQAIAKGQARLASGATSGMAKYEARIQAVLDAEKSIIASLPSRGTVEQNIERSRQFQLSMHQAFNR
jgi:hypothetical protein